MTARSDTTPAAAPASAPAAAARHNLPAQPTPLIGREAELAAVRGRLLRADSHLVTLTGPPGTGKTRLALAVAADLAEHFEHGVWFVPLDTIPDPNAVVPAVARSLGLRETAGRSATELLAEHLHERHLLLLLDNFEQVIVAAPRVSELLAACPRLSVLVTSRAPLRLRWEHQYAVAPLPAPLLGGDPLPPLGSQPARPHAEGGEGPVLDPQHAALVSEYAAVRLWVQRAQAAVAGFQLTDTNAGTVAAICARLDGLPLALELAAAKVKLLSPAAILERLGQRLAFLTRGARDLPERHQTLRAAIAWSYELLSPAERALFRQLGVFLGGCTVEAATALAGPVLIPEPALPGPRRVGGEESEANGSSVLTSPHPHAAVSPQPSALVEDGLASLLDQSLLQPVATPAGDGADEPRLRMLETIREYALEQLAAEGEEEDTRLRHAAFFLALAEAADAKLTGAEQAVWLARVEQEHDNLRAALTWALAEQRTDLALQLCVSLRRFWLLHAHFTEGRRWLERALAGEHGPVVLRARALEASGILAFQQADYAAARVAFEQLLPLGRELGNLGGVAAALNQLGMIAHRRGDPAAARDRYEESLEICRETGNTGAVASLLNNLGLLAQEQGDHVYARDRLAEALTLHRDTGDGNNIAGTLVNLAAIAQAEDDLDTAQRELDEALAVRRTLGNPAGIASVLDTSGLLAQRRGELDAARTLHEEALALRRQLGAKGGIVISLDHLGHLARRAGDLSGAGAWFAESLLLAQELEQPGSVAASLAALASLAVQQRCFERGARLYGAAEGLRAAHGVEPPPGGRAQQESDETTLRDSLGDTVLAASWLAGSALPLEDAIAEAISGRDERPAPAVASSPIPSPSSLPHGLTAREIEVLRLVAAGRSSRQIADELVLSTHTIDRHIANLYRKIDAHGRAEAAAYAIRHGLL